MTNWLVAILETEQPNYFRTEAWINIAETAPTLTCLFISILFRSKSESSHIPAAFHQRQHVSIVESRFCAVIFFLAYFAQSFLPIFRCNTIQRIQQMDDTAIASL